MRIHVKKMIDATWRDANYVIFREGEFQTPVAILSELDARRLAEDIKDAIGLKNGKP